MKSSRNSSNLALNLMSSIKAETPAVALNLAESSTSLGTAYSVASSHKPSWGQIRLKPVSTAWNLTQPCPHTLNCT